jgi:hypothetical protein
MALRIPQDLVVLFGSETRVRVLAVLASAFGPMTAYRVAKVGEVAISKAYDEIKHLAEGNVVFRQGSGWVLRDPDVRLLLRERIPVIWWSDWWSEKDRTIKRSQDILRRSLAHSLPLAQKGWKPRTDIHRDPRKDELLLEMGERSSTHG